MKPPFTTWDAVPLVCDIETTARVLRRSVRDIHRDLAANVMEPAPMPMVNPRGRKHQRRLWSKAALQAHLDGGYLVFAQRATNQQLKRRHFFGSVQKRAS